MATHTLSAHRAAVTLSPAQLSAAREALVARIDAAADDVLRGADLSGMPFHLISASCFLVEQGVAAPACRGEELFAWDMSVSRQFLNGLDPAARAEEIEAGRAALFDGRRAICASVLDLAGELIDAGVRFAQAEAAITITADALRARWARNAAIYAGPAGKAVAA